MSTIITAQWCGACGSPVTGRTCPTCSLPVVGDEADALRTCSTAYRAALASGDLGAAELARARHAQVRELLARSVLAHQSGGEPEAAATARSSASTLITWVGAALLLAGALAFASVVWQYAGGPSRVAILAVVTVVALVAADRLREIAPITAEACVAILAGMVVVDVIALRVAGYTSSIELAPWIAMTLLPFGLALLALARRWSSRTAAACAWILVGVGSAALGVWPLTWDQNLGESPVLALAAGLATAGLGAVAQRVPQAPDRVALIVAAACLWVVQLGGVLITLVAYLIFPSSSVPGTRILALATAVSTFALLPLVVRLTHAATGALAGLVASGPMTLSVWLTLGTISTLPLEQGRMQALQVLALALLLLVPTGLWVVRAGRGVADRSRASAFATILVIAYAFGSLVLLTLVQRDSDDVRLALVVAALGLVAAIPAVALQGRTAPWVTDLAAGTAIAGLVGAAGIAAPPLIGVPSGDAMSVAAAIVMLSTLVVRSRAWVPAAQAVAVVTIAVAPFTGLTRIENWSIPAAVVAVGLAAAAWHRGARSSWLIEAPVAALLLVPTLVVALDGDETGLRLTCVCVAAALVLLDAARRRRQGPAVVAVAAIAVSLSWALLPRISEIPSWAALAVTGSLLLWVGFTWERSRATARHLAQSWSTWA